MDQKKREENLRRTKELLTRKRTPEEQAELEKGIKKLEEMGFFYLAQPREKDE